MRRAAITGRSAGSRGMPAEPPIRAENSSSQSWSFAGRPSIARRCSSTAPPVVSRIIARNRPTRAEIDGRRAGGAASATESSRASARRAEGEWLGDAPAASAPRLRSSQRCTEMPIRETSSLPGGIASEADTERTRSSSKAGSSVTRHCPPTRAREPTNQARAGDSIRAINPAVDACAAADTARD